MAPIKIIGYALAVAGLVGIAFSSTIAKLLSFLGAKALVYTMVGAAALVAVGIVFVLTESKGGSKVSQSSEEVPIYEGTGKHRKIIGYQKAAK